MFAENPYTVLSLTICTAQGEIRGFFLEKHRCTIAFKKEIENHKFKLIYLFDLGNRENCKKCEVQG